MPGPSDILLYILNIQTNRTPESKTFDVGNKMVRKLLSLRRVISSFTLLLFKQQRISIDLC